MKSLDPALAHAYERAKSYFTDAHYKETGANVTVEDALRAHFLLIDAYSSGEGFGGVGPKDHGMLESAIHRQYAGMGNIQKWNTIYEISATTFFGLIKNHPFHDGNKRTALLTTLYQLHKNGLVTTCKHHALERLTVSTSASTLEEYHYYRKFAKRGDPDIHTIAEFLKRNTRKQDTSEYIITFRELSAILSKYGYAMVDPSNNYIHIDRISTPGFIRRILGHNTQSTRIMKIGFPGWKKEVYKSDVRRIRKALSLTKEHGIDSQVFYRDAEPMESLLRTFREPLRRLADK